MKQYMKNGLRTALLIWLLFSANSSWAATTDLGNNDFTIDVNDVLAACAGLLLLVIFVLGYTLRASIFFYHEKRKSQSKSLTETTKILGLTILLLGMGSSSSWAQAMEPTASTTAISDVEVIRWILILVIVLETVVIFYFARLIRFFTGVEAYVGAQKKAPRFKFDLNKIWVRMNRLRPIEEEASLDTGHSYDGIRELNNVTPPWFIMGFALSILFAIVYLWRYHIAESAPLQIEEYNTSVIEAKIKLDEYLKTQANNVDENTVVMLDAEGIAAGQALFAANCVPCHGDKGQGASVGPNLSDNYWLHQGSIVAVFKSIKYGWQEKGMKSWKDDFSPNQIAQLASYVLSLKGSNPAGAKEPQGDLYVAEASAKDTTTHTINGTQDTSMQVQ